MAPPADREGPPQVPARWSGSRRAHLPLRAVPGRGHPEAGGWAQRAAPPQLSRRRRRIDGGRRR
eukprot:5241729-Alexandrium_andersonii.AAC.1